MTSPSWSSITWLRAVADRLGDLRPETVFLGGATLELLITDPGAGAPRPTKDIDLIVEHVVRDIRTLRAMWRVLETGLRSTLYGHEEGNLGDSQGKT
ncbi:MAG: hypothetical protein RBU30_26330 [Polyangia bacterium]|jgi:hypothetical protein|nr:hypothetical protein [Polyangia bacterium]